jgi:signal transduction histidine kinase
MRRRKGSPLVENLLALGALSPAQDPSALCTLLMSACHAQAVLLFAYDKQRESWRLQASSGLGIDEQDAVSRCWHLPAPSVWGRVPSGTCLSALAEWVEATRGTSLPTVVDPNSLHYVRMVRNNDRTRLLFLLTDPSPEVNEPDFDEWQLITRILGLLLKQSELQDEKCEQESTLEQNRSNLVTLLDILNSACGESPVNNLYESTVDALQRITHADAVVLRRYDDVNGCLHLVAERGLSPELKAKIQCVAERPIFKDLLREKRAGVRPTINPEAWDLGYIQAVSVPLVASERVVGSVSLMDRSGDPPSVDKLRWLEILGRCVALMIRQVHQAEVQWENAVLQERSHLAREIHDGFAQSLAALQLLIEEQQAQLEEGDIQSALDLSSHLRLLADDAYSSVREEIQALHDEGTFEGGLRGFLDGYLPRFEHHWGIECQADLEPNDGALDVLNLHPAVQSQLTRIIQEALANVRKHSGASRVRVMVRSLEGELRVSVEDDGKGFEMERIPAGTYGLRIMQERAISVGGAITISSSQDRGTLLEVVVPAILAVPGDEAI